MSRDVTPGSEETGSAALLFSRITYSDLRVFLPNVASRGWGGRPRDLWTPASRNPGLSQESGPAPSLPCGALSMAGPSTAATAGTSRSSDPGTRSRLRRLSARSSRHTASALSPTPPRWREGRWCLAARLGRSLQSSEEVCWPRTKHAAVPWHSSSF